MGKCQQCIGLEFFSEQEMITAAKDLYASWYGRDFQEPKAFGAEYRELVRENTYFKISDHHAGIYIGEELVSAFESVVELERYSKEAIRDGFAGVILWKVRKCQTYDRKSA